MNSGLHLAAGWLVAESFNLDYPQRRLVALASVAPDLDCLSIVFGTDAFRTYHHYLFHNLLSLFVMTGLVAALTRSRKATLAAFLGVALHFACDFLASNWDLFLFEPFWDLRLNLTDVLPFWMVVYLFQGLGTVVVLGLVVWVAWRRERTFLEVFIRRGDLLVVRWFLRWLQGRRCFCGARAHFVCHTCGKDLCGRHIVVWRRPLRILCRTCAAQKEHPKKSNGESL